MQTNMKGRALSFIRENLCGWREILEESIEITRLTGNSNDVFLVKPLQSGDLPPLIYRVFGSDAVTSKQRERSIYNLLAEAGVGPQSYGVNETERIEEFLEGYDPIAKEGFHEKSLLTLIVREIKRFCAVDAQDLLGSEGLICIEHPRKWRELSKRRILRNPSFLLEEYKEEIEELVLKDSYWDLYLEMLPSGSPVVFSHMDPSPLNFLYNSSQNTVRFVDFEFAGYSYRSFDIASLLNEVQYDYTYPEHPYWKRVKGLEPGDGLLAEYASEYCEDPREFWVELKKMGVACNYLWALWSFAMYEGNREGYDYLAYAVERFREFKGSLQKYEDSGGLEGLLYQRNSVFPS